MSSPNIIDSKVTAPYDSAFDLILTSPGAISVNESGNDELYALRFSSNNLIGTLNGAISSKGDGTGTYGIMFSANGNLIFSAGKAAITVAGKQNVSGIWGGLIQLSSAAGPLAGAVNVTGKSDISATVIGFDAVTKFVSQLAMTVSATATGGVNANATGFEYEMAADAGFDDKFKLAVTAKAGTGSAWARGTSDRITVAGTLAGTVSIVANAAKGSRADAVGLVGVTGITDVSDKFKLTVTAKAGSRDATAYGMSGSLELSGVLAGAITVTADAAKGNNATNRGLVKIDGASSISDKFKFGVTAKAGWGSALAHGLTDAIRVLGVGSGTFTVSATAAKGTTATAFGALSMTAGSVGDKFKLGVTAKAGSGAAYAQGLGGMSSVTGMVSGNFAVSADASKGTSAEAAAINGINCASIGDQFKLNVSAKAGSGTATAKGFFGRGQLAGGLAGTITISADASKGTGAYAYGAIDFQGITDVSDKFMFTVTAKAGSGSATTQGILEVLSASGDVGGSFVIASDAAKGTSADATFCDDIDIGDSVSDSFYLSVTAKAGSQNASAKGASGSMFIYFASGSYTIVADAAKGTGAVAYLTNIFSAQNTSELLKIAVTANAGSGDASAYWCASMTLSGAISGNIVISADSVTGTSAVANGVSGSVGGTFSLDRYFKLAVTAKAGTGDAVASAFNTLAGDWGIAGAVLVSADAAKGDSAEANGFKVISGLRRCWDSFTLAVSAKAGSGKAAALGMGINNITNGLNGTVTVAAESAADAAEAIGCKILSGTLLTVLQTCTVTVAAKTSSADDYAIAAGLSGATGYINMAGQLAVTAAGIHSVAYGLLLDQIMSGSAVDGVIGAIGNQAYGVCGGDGASLVVRGGIYGGTAGNAAAIAKSLQKAVGSYKSAAMLNKNADMAVQMGDDSTLSLTKGSVVIGDVSLGSDSTVNLSIGSQLYGDMLMSAGNVNITVDSMLNKAATVNLSSAGAGVFAPGSNVSISITANAGTQAGSYVLLAGSDLSELDNVNFNTLYHLAGFDANDLVASWQLDHGKTDTLTLIVSEKADMIILGSQPFGGASSLLSASPLTGDLLAIGEGAWNHTTLA